MAEILAVQQKAKFGSVKEISAVDYVDEVNKAGEGVWVVLHLYKTGQVAASCQVVACRHRLHAWWSLMVIVNSL